jgi:hypothetical protein
MTRCLDEARLQSYFDGELSMQSMESVTSHLASCVTCAAAARELEEETALLTAALTTEFESSVPTDRLRQRIDAAVLGERYAAAQVNEKSNGLAGFFGSLLNFGSQRTLAYASLAVLLAFAAIFGLMKMKRTPEQVAKAPEVVKVNDTIAQAGPGDSQNIPPVETANPPKARPVAVHPIKVSERSSAAKPAPPVKLFPGERSYLQTIAKLDTTIKSNKKSMRPSLQVEYERNLAVVDRAIAATRSAAKSNPNDPDAADFMFAAYQSKVDLLNTIADARVGGGRGH